MCLILEGAAKECLLTVVDSESKKGVDLSEEVLQVMRKLGINGEKLAFQCYDFASSMSGHFEGAQAHTSKKLRRNVPYLRCITHRGIIIVEYCCKSSSLTRNMFGVLQQTYNFFTWDPSASICTTRL